MQTLTFAVPPVSDVAEELRYEVRSFIVTELAGRTAQGLGTVRAPEQLTRERVRTCSVPEGAGLTVAINAARLAENRREFIEGTECVRLLLVRQGTDRVAVLPGDGAPCCNQQQRGEDPTRAGHAG